VNPPIDEPRPPRYERIALVHRRPELEGTTSEVRRVGVIVFVAGAALGAGAYWIAAARKRRKRRRWHVSGIRVWGARTF